MDINKKLLLKQRMDIIKDKIEEVDTNQITQQSSIIKVTKQAEQAFNNHEYDSLQIKQ